jgi:hypothetical protein
VNNWKKIRTTVVCVAMLGHEAHAWRHLDELMKHTEFEMPPPTDRGKYKTDAEVGSMAPLSINAADAVNVSD